VRKILAEFTRLNTVVSSHPLPIIKDSSLLVELSATQRGIQELRDTCRIDDIPLQEEAVTVKILEALTKVVEVTKGILLRLEEGHVLPPPSATAAVDEAALNLSLINAARRNVRQPSLQQRTAGQLYQVFFEDSQRNANNILTSNIPYGVGARAPRISCLREQNKPDRDIVRQCSKRWRATGIFQTDHQTSRCAYLNTDTP